MFHLTIPSFLLLYFLAISAGVLGLWLAGEVIRVVEARRWRRDRTLCRHCGLIYVDLSEDPLPQCPVCEKRNERGGAHRI